WGPQAIGDYGTPVSLPKLKKAYEKGSHICDVRNAAIPAHFPHCIAITLCLQSAEGRGGLTTHGAPGQ
ncbi:unnamed protein product, partial [Staurois parvus]